jgi:hypothetical protein
MSRELHDLIIDINTGRLDRMVVTAPEYLDGENARPLTEALSRMSGSVRIDFATPDEEQLRPILNAAAPFIRTLFVHEPRSIDGCVTRRVPFMSSFPHMPHLENLVISLTYEDDRRPLRRTEGLLVPHVATLKNLVVRQLPDYRDDEFLAGLAATLRSMPRLESLSISPHDIRRCYVSLSAVAQFCIPNAEDPLPPLESTSQLVPLPASLKAISLVLVRDGRFLPDVADLPLSIEYVTVYQGEGDGSSGQLRPMAIEGLFAALPRLARVDDRTSCIQYSYNAARVLETRCVSDGSFHDAGPGWRSVEEQCREIISRAGGWDELVITPCVKMREIRYGERLGPESKVYTRSTFGGLEYVRRGDEPEPDQGTRSATDPIPLRMMEATCLDEVSLLCDAAKSCERISRFGIDYGEALQERGAAAVAGILGAHPEMQELQLFCSTMDDKAAEIMLSAIRRHPCLRVIRYCSRRGAEWKDRLRAAVLDLNDCLRRGELDRAALEVARASVRRSGAGRRSLPWHSYSVGGRIGEFVGASRKRRVQCIGVGSRYEDMSPDSWLTWFLPGRNG